MNKLSKKDLMNLKSEVNWISNPTHLAVLSGYIPRLVDEILELRKESERWKFKAQTSHWN